MSGYIKIGQIINTHGNKGELKVYPLTDDVRRFCELEHLFILQNGEYQKYLVEKARIHKGMGILALREIDNMNDAESLRNLYVELPEEQLLPLPEGHFYIFQIIGLAVFENDIYLGKVTDVLKTGSNDVYVITNPENNNVFYLPALKEVVKNIDISSGKMEVQIPPGLLD